MKDTLVPGLQASYRHRVVTENLVSHFHPNGPPVLGSPFMLLLMETAAFQAIAPHLDDDEQSVGIGFDFEHLAATPAGQWVEARATVRQVMKRRVVFDIEAHDEHEPIGRGTHVRAVIRMSRFLQRLRAKQST